MSKVLESGVSGAKNLLKNSHLVLGAAAVVLLWGFSLGLANQTDVGKSILSHPYVQPALPSISIAFLASVIAAFKLEGIFRGELKPDVSPTEFLSRFAVLAVVVYGLLVLTREAQSLLGLESFEFCPE